jgi:hypothetical protein
MTDLLLDVPVARYVVRKDGKFFLGTPSGGQDLHFETTNVRDAVKFGTKEDAELLIRHLFDIPPLTKWDGKDVAPDPDAPPHIGKFHGEDKSTLEILATHT